MRCLPLFKIMAAGLIGLSAGLAAPCPAWADFPRFVAEEIDPDIGKVCYAVTLADVNGDGRQDVVAVSESCVFWYENPSWRRHVIIDNQTPLDNVCIDAHDIDGDGQVDFALGAGWTRTGTVHWLQRGQSLDQPWTVHFIADLRLTHRMRFADVLGTGKPQLVVSPLNAVEGAAGVELTALEVPDQPAMQRWLPTVIDGQLNRMHNHWHLDWNGDGEIQTLTASREGVHRVYRDGNSWQRQTLGRGAIADDPNQSGAGEIKTGQLADGKRFIATVEPMHGTALAVYLPPTDDQPSDGDGAGSSDAADGDAADDSGHWRRVIVDEGFRRGHALWTVDMDGDGRDEIVFGHSDTPEVFGVTVYRARDAAGTRWEKHVIDAGGMATEDLVVGDLDGDGRPDIVAGGRATKNVKIYWNKPQ